MFVGNISVKPSRDFTRPLGMPRGLKRLVAYAKCNRVSYDKGGRVVVYSCLILFLVL